jgi:hypothetical protein
LGITPKEFKEGMKKWAPNVNHYLQEVKRVTSQKVITAHEKYKFF